VSAAPDYARTGGVIVARHPGEGFRERVEALRRHVDGVLVVDNGSSRRGLEQLEEARTIAGVEIFLNGRNRGVAVGFNQGVEWARARGYPWLLLADQDTELEEDAFATIREAWRSYPDREKIAVLGCNFFDPNARRLQYDLTPGHNAPWTERETVISAGSLLSLEALGEIGGFREEFFIDSVDHEYCLRARSRGFHVLATRRAVMRHTVGAARVHAPTGLVTRNAAPERWYFMVRNEVILIRDYLFREPHWAFVAAISRLQALLVMLCFEDRRLAKLRFAGRGLVDGIRGRFLGPHG
jgi:rhamnosyltransferase